MDYLFAFGQSPGMDDPMDFGPPATLPQQQQQQQWGQAPPALPSNWLTGACVYVQ
jgi:hypothetical protein